MSELNPIGQPGPIEMLAEWQGPAIPAPGVLLDEKQEEQLLTSGDAAVLAAWIAVRALPDRGNNGIHEAIRAKVRNTLINWRDRFGSVKLDEVKQHLLQRVQEHIANAKATAAELARQVDALFQELDQ